MPSVLEEGCLHFCATSISFFMFSLSSFPPLERCFLKSERTFRAGWVELLYRLLLSGFVLLSFSQYLFAGINMQIVIC